jgi:hypothetical protein
MLAFRALMEALPQLAAEAVVLAPETDAFTSISDSVSENLHNVAAYRLQKSKSGKVR